MSQRPYDPWATAPAWAYELRDILASVALKLQTMETIMPILDEIQTELEGLRSASDSVMLLLDTATAKLDEALAAGDLGKAQQILDDIKTEKQELVDAALRNTPADPNAPPA